MALLTRALEADGKGVWSWHPDAGVKFALRRAGDGGKRADSPGRARYRPLKPLRRECRIASAEPVCSCAFLLCTFAHETAGAVCTRYSLLPRFSRDNVRAKLRALSAPRECETM